MIAKAGMYLQMDSIIDGPYTLLLSKIMPDSLKRSDNNNVFACIALNCVSVLFI